MKKFTILLASLAVMASSVPAFAGKDRIIAVGELPAVSQQFVQTHFKGVEVSYAKVDEELFDKDYKVVFVNGSKVEFAKDGQWKEVDCKYGEVPAAVVPQQIRDYVAKNFAGRKIVSIDRADAQLPQGSIFIADLLGLPVYDGETPIGRLTDVMSTPANDVYVVKGEDGQEHLIPAVPEFVLERNVDEGYIRVRLIEGM